MTSNATAGHPASHPPSDRAAMLTPDERARFQQDGWVGSYSLLGPQEIDRLCRLRAASIHKFTGPNALAAVSGADEFARKPWYKSMHAYLPDYYDIACHPDIVGRVVSLLGPDLIAWGLTLIRAVPGRIHRWHVDIEHRHWEGVSVFLGLANMDTHSTLKVIEGSHRVKALPQTHRLGDDDERAVGLVRAEVPQARALRVPLQPGEFFIFDGQLWHGSHNTGDQTRIALISHYSRPDARVRIPRGFNEPMQWYDFSPPCVLVAGEDRHRVNRLVERPGPDALP